MKRPNKEELLANAKYRERMAKSAVTEIYAAMMIALKKRGYSDDEIFSIAADIQGLWQTMSGPEIIKRCEEEMDVEFKKM